MEAKGRHPILLCKNIPSPILFPSLNEVKSGVWALQAVSYNGDVLLFREVEDGHSNSV